jgi:hypothetical protein
MRQSCLDRLAGTSRGVRGKNQGPAASAAFRIGSMI